MSEETTSSKTDNVRQLRAEQKPIDASYVIVLKDFDGQIINSFKFSEPLRFPYLFWEKAFFVTSKEDPTVFLQRSYHVMVNKDERPAPRYQSWLLRKIENEKLNRGAL